MSEPRIITPSPAQVRRYLKKWDKLDNYVLQDSSLRKLFTKTYRYNRHMDDVLIKVCSLNDFYSTNIFSPFAAAKHIVDLKIDKRLKAGDLGVVNELAKMTMSNGNPRNNYSFATKYCSHHRPNVYPIYDSFVDKMLMYFKRTHKFSKFTNRDLKEYPVYCDVLARFMAFYELEKFTLRDVDRYLWLAGKEAFPKRYYSRRTTS